MTTQIFGTSLRDAGSSLPDIDGVSTAGETSVTVAHYLGITPNESTAPRSAAARS
jgi:hypothetical protein